MFIGSEVILVFALNIGNIQILLPVIPHSHSCPQVIGATDQGVTQELAEDRARVQLLYQGGLRDLVSSELLLPFEGGECGGRGLLALG